MQAASNFRYQPLDEAGVLVPDRHFRAHLAHADETRAAVSEAAAQLTAWTIRFTDAARLNEVPLYALRHAAEYLAPGPGLRDLLARPAWFSKLERRCHSRSACIKALERTLAELDLHFTDDITVVKMLLCALVRASLSATLLPELVAQLVRLGLCEALDYAENYTSQANRQALHDLLAHPAQPLNFPVGSAVAEAAQILRRYATLLPALWLQPILATLARFAHADLIEALELLAPTLRTLFPACMDELCGALQQIGQALL